MAGHPGAEAALGVQRIVNGAADVFLLVVEAGIDFVKPARLGPALAKLAPIVDRLAGRTSVAAAGEVAEGVGGHLLGLQAELEAVKFAGIAPRLGVGRRGDEERGQRNDHGPVGWAKAPRTVRKVTLRRIAPCPPRRSRWARRERPSNPTHASPCAFAHPTTHFFIGSHCLVSLPQKSTQSSYVAGPLPTSFANRNFTTASTSRLERKSFPAGGMSLPICSRV